MHFLFIQKPVTNRIKIDYVNYKNRKKKSRCNPEVKLGSLDHYCLIINSVIPKAISQKQSKKKNNVVVKRYFKFHKYRL